VRAGLLNPHALHHRILRIAKLVTPFVVWIVGESSISVRVSKLSILYGVGGFDWRVADSETGDFEPMDGRDRVVVAHGISDLDLDGRVAEAVVCEDLVGEFVHEAPSSCEGGLVLGAVCCIFGLLRF
jgi:hypothetical protein